MEIENFNNNSEDVSMNGNSLIIDVITDNFMTDVIEQSKETPVIVDFWAPWCEPCKQLTPIIERIIKEKNGKVILAKMNIDESPEVAQQLKIQSIPAVMAFNDGQPIDGFIGVQSEKNIIEFVNKISSLKNSSTIEENISAGKKYMNEGDIETATLVFSEILKIEPDNISAKSLLARCLIKNDQLNDAEKIINSLPVGAESNQDYISVRSELEIFKNAKNNPISDNEEQELRNNIDKEPENYQLRLDLSKILMAKGENEEAINQLLRIIEVNPKWNDGEARKQLIEIFNILGNENILVTEGRKKLSSMLFS
ncbi:MAG: thioredoxin [Pseudomonadota bacterium]|nr:thioredoxin [Pseudomonadota bacterium]MEC8797088.1 thioredoxin [Pseudomonadota bacterium]|tara:strand:- start:1394 stop:2326 length:933 start_codon:yes stop_codon:yes gene_type:complete